MGVSAVVRPYGVVVEGSIEFGLELVLEKSRIREIRPHTGPPEAFVLSPAFVNSHSHLEYRGLQGRIGAREFWPWIRELTSLKASEQLEEVRGHTLIAALENRATGVAIIAEHSDRPTSGRAMAEVGLKGVIFQETITFLERENAAKKVLAVEERARTQSQDFGGPVFPSPHSIYTVDPATLKRFGASGEPISIHIAESQAENEFARDGAGPIADFHRAHGLPVAAHGMSAFQLASSLGLVRKGVQLVHCCALSDQDLESLAESGAFVAHCPRSNLRLGCPLAPIRRMLDAGVVVGLGMDSPASGGPIDFFDEMRAAMRVAKLRNEPLTAEQVWRMATEWGARTLGYDHWGIRQGSTTPLIAIEVGGAQSTEDLIRLGNPGLVRWIT